MIECTFEDGGKAFLRHLVVDAIGVKDGKLLMIKRAMYLTDGGKYALPGGFVDKDEHLDEALVREVLEETGYTCKVLNLLWINDDPNRTSDGRQNVAFVYIVEIGEKVSEPDKETTEVKWFDLEQLPSAEYIAFDHLEMIELYKKYKKENTQLPILNNK